MEEEYEALKKIKRNQQMQKKKVRKQKNYLLTDIEYKERIKNLDKGKELIENIREISKFTLATLDYGIDVTAFNIEWFKKLKKRI